MSTYALLRQKSLWATRRGGRSIADFDTAIKFNPKFANAHNNRGNAYKEKGQYDLTFDDYDKAIKLNPKDANAYGKRGIAYEFFKERDKAIADFRKVLELHPGDKLGTAGLKRLGVTP